KVSFSEQEITLDAIANYHADVQAGLFEFFNGNSEKLKQRYSLERKDKALNDALSELDLSSSMNVLAAVEALIRIDYLNRVYQKKRDQLSRKMRALHDEKANKARLEDDLIQLWRSEVAVKRVLLDDLTGAFKYRHWLAHGRYWSAKLGRKYSFESVFEIAQEFSAVLEAHQRD
ncbi:hypothetical protein, partial [Acinetobacter pittii]